MATSRRFVQITDKEINKIKITCVKIIKITCVKIIKITCVKIPQARRFSEYIHLDFVSVNIPR